MEGAAEESAAAATTKARARLRAAAARMPAAATGAAGVATPPPAAAAGSPAARTLRVDRGAEVERVHTGAGQRWPTTAAATTAAAQGAAAEGERRRSSTKAQTAKAAAAARGGEGAVAAAVRARELPAASAAPPSQQAPTITAAAAGGAGAGGGPAAGARKTTAASKATAADAAAARNARAAGEAQTRRPDARTTAAEGQRQRPYSAGAQPRRRGVQAPAGEGGGGAEEETSLATAAEMEERRQICLTCSECGRAVEDVLLLSCRHYICLLCAAAAAQALEPPQPRSVSDDEGERAASRARRRSNIDVLPCPVCGVPTVLSVSATAAVRQRLHFFENPPGCCFDAGPVGVAAPAAAAADGGRHRQQGPWVELCSQCERQAAAVYCRSCVRRFCGACAVAAHKDHPRLLTHPFQLLHQQQQLRQRRGSEGGLALGADLPLPPPVAALQQAARHMRTIDDCFSCRSSLRGSSPRSLRARGGARRREEQKAAIQRRDGGAGGGGGGEAGAEDVDSVHSSAIRGDWGEDEAAAGRGAPLEGAALLHRLRKVLAAMPLSPSRPLEAAVAGLRGAAPRLVPPELLRLRTVTNVACYAHASQPVEFFCCSCECYCVCAYCLTGFVPSGTAAAPTGGGAGAGRQQRSQDHTGHFLQAVDAAWRETVLPRIEDDWGGGGALGAAAAATSTEEEEEAAAAAGADEATAAAAGAGREEGGGGRGILGQVRGELELLQQSLLQEKRREWARSLQRDASTVAATSQLLLQRLQEKEQQLCMALEVFTARFCTECDEARARLHHQTAQLQQTLRQLRIHKAALDPAVLLNYYREERGRLEALRAADTPQEYRQLPLSRKSVLEHAAQVTEELCGLTAELGTNVREADGTLFERLQRQQQQQRDSSDFISLSRTRAYGETHRRPTVEATTAGSRRPAGAQD